MADEKRAAANQGGKGGDGKKKGRRHYFRLKKREGRGKEEPAEQPQRQAKGNAKLSAAEQSVRSARAKRRRRRSQTRQTPADNRPSILQEIEADYSPPSSVFIYTHVSRPDQRDSYEFRPEHFSKGSRRLEDFQINLSSLFEETDTDEPGPLRGLTLGAFDFGPEEEESVAASLAEDGEETAYGVNEEGLPID